MIRARTSILAVPLLALLMLAGALSAQAGQSSSELDSLYDRAKAAIEQKNYETAVRLLAEAKARFPEATQVSLALGELYYDKELYTLALEEYRDAEKKGAVDLSTLTQISRCYGKLNREKSSIEYLERIIAAYPDSSESYDDLGWMFFKTHSLEKGEQILLKGIGRFGLESGMAMTLGTVYSGMNRYDRSREFYMKAIEKALAADDRTFAAIAYYNLSLLEQNFYNYNSALRFTDESLAMDDRPSGHLARGELFQSRMEFRPALEEYEKARAADTTPLSRLNLGLLHQEFGNLELARRYGEEVLASKDLAWMLYYGTDITRHFMDVHELLADTHEGLARMAAARPTAGPFERISALVSALRHWASSRFYRQRFRVAALKVGSAYLAEGSLEEAYLQFFRANAGYTEVAAKYLGLARALETARTPHAEGFYLLEEGILKGSAGLLERSIAELDQFWEREAMAEALRAMIPLLRRKQEAIEKLFDINPGALPQAGIGLPLSVSFEGGHWGRREKRLIGRYLKRAHSEIGTGARHALRLVRGTAGDVRFSVADSRTGRPVAEGSAKGAASRIVQAVLDALYAVE
jgi:tetratricopeptide (TPR) repeat protein